MLLDALLAATERLIITYTGNDERTNLRRPPAVPVGELLDIVERTVSCARGLGARAGRGPPSAAAVRPAELHPGRLVPGRAVGVRPAGARRRERAEPAARDPAAVPGRRRCRRGTTPWSSSDNLIRFVEHPVRAFLRDRLGISVSEFYDEVRGRDARSSSTRLERWGVGQRLLEGVLAGAELEACMQAEIARGRAATRASSRARRSPRSAPSVEPDRRRGDGARRPTGEPGSLDVNLALAGRAHARRHGHRRVRGRAPRDLLLAGQAARPAARVGEAARAERRAPRAAVRIGRDRPGARRRALGRRHGGADRAARGRPVTRGARPRSRSSRCCSTSTTAGCASRCRSRATPPPPTPRRWRPARTPTAAAARGAGRPCSGSTRRTASPSTCSCYGDARPLGAAARATAARRRAGTGLGPGRDDAVRALRAAAVARPARGRGGERPMSDRRRVRRFDLCGPLPVGRHRARGERRHRQDVHDRRARRALRRRGHAARPAAADHVHADGDRRAPRPRPRAARRRASSSSRGSSPARPTRETDAIVTLLATGSPRRGRRCAATGWRAPSPTSTPPRSPPRTASARRCWPSSARSATSIARRRSSRTSSTCSSRRSTTCTCGGSAAAGRRRFTRAAGAADRAGGGRQPDGRARAASTARRQHRRRCATGWRRAVRDELEQRKRRLAIMTYDDLLTRLNEIARRPERPGGERAPAHALRGRARRRVPGHRPDPVADPAPRVRDRGRDAGADRRPQAGDLRVPRRRRVRLPRRRPRPPTRAPRCASTGAATSRCSTPSTRCSAARSSATRTSSTARCGPRRPPDAAVCAARRATPRCASGSCTATSRRSSRPTTGTPGRRRRARTSRATSPPTSCGCCPRTRRSSIAAPTASRPRRAVCPRRHRGARPHAPRTPTLVRDAADRRARPGGDQRRAAACSAPTAARDWLRLLEALERPASTIRARTGGADAVPRLERPSGSRPPASPTWEEVHQRLHRWARIAARRRRRRADRGDHGRRGPRRAGARRRRTASGG